MEFSKNNRYAKRALNLPSHAYHPNASFRFETRKAYIAWPQAGRSEKTMK